MSFEGGKLIWLNGRMVPWDQATIHVMAHALHYGSSVFEGIRVYKTPVSHVSPTSLLLKMPTAFFSSN